jgi:hypothetical protein
MVLLYVYSLYRVTFVGMLLPCVDRQHPSNRVAIESSRTPLKGQLCSHSGQLRRLETPDPPMVNKYTIEIIPQRLDGRRKKTCVVFSPISPTT